MYYYLALGIEGNISLSRFDVLSPFQLPQLQEITDNTIPNSKPQNVTIIN